MDGPLAEVLGQRPEQAMYRGSAQHLGDVLIAVRASLRGVLEHVTIADIHRGDLSGAVTDHLSGPESWMPR